MKDTQMHFRQLMAGFVSLLLMLSSSTTSYSQEALEPIPIEDSVEIITDECACDCEGVESGEIFTIVIEDPFDANRLYTLVMNYPDSLNASDVFASIAVLANRNYRNVSIMLTINAPSQQRRKMSQMPTLRNDWMRGVTNGRDKPSHG
jgi:hypothetical protein